MEEIKTDITAKAPESTEGGEAGKTAIPSPAVRTRDSHVASLLGMTGELPRNGGGGEEDCHSETGPKTGRGNLKDGNAVSGFSRSVDAEPASPAGRIPVPAKREPGEAGDAEPATTWLESMRRQETELRRIMPGFDLAAELRDPFFARMVTRDGLDVKTAYLAVVSADIAGRRSKSYAARRESAAAVGAARPRENGGGAPVTPPSFDPRKLSRAQREDIRRAVRDAAARGEKYYLPY